MIDLRKLPYGTRVMAETTAFMYEITVIQMGPGNSMEVSVSTGDPDMRKCAHRCCFNGSIVIDLVKGVSSAEHLCQIVPEGRMHFHDSKRVHQTQPVISAVVYGKDFEFEVF